MKIYIAGMITGNGNYKAEFEAAARCVRERGCIPLNPATLPEGMCNADYMRICFAMIDTADEVWFLPDWEYSRGASIERAYCDYIGKRCRELNSESEEGGTT